MIYSMYPHGEIIKALIAAFDPAGRQAPSKEDVRSKAEAMARVFEYKGGLDNIITQVLGAVTTVMDVGISLIRRSDRHKQSWPDVRDIDWVYSVAYANHLQERHWSQHSRDSLGRTSLELLRLLQDPLLGGAWDRRGLVIGQVQSGKTANYLGLIARAADAGYKLIIVIAGIHNVLRSQTQQRVDEAFVGLDSISKKPMGVGKQSGYPNPVTLTTTERDFTRQTADVVTMNLEQLTQPVVLVIKKNVQTLQALHGWLSRMNAPYGGLVMSVPMLMIDDEADHASINTNHPDLDPTKTNSLIRSILRLFAQSCYVGYTATPFANIFINPDIYEDGFNDTLFPSDFIYCLSSPSSYFGPEEIFLSNGSDSSVTVPIADCEEVLPVTHKLDHDLSQLPPSLEQAICQFVVARAIRNLRGQAAHHCTMMVNVSRFVRIQKCVRELVQEYVKAIQNAIQIYYRMPDESAQGNAYMRQLKEVHETEYAGTPETWDQVKAALHEAADLIQVVLINNQSQEQLNFKEHARGGQGLTAIAIGGLSLSRGLTLEGLAVSYVYRNTRMYDTLMQMGRWFGYRAGYQDLCRVYLSQDAIDWYEHIAEISRDLVGQVYAMRAQGKTPRDMGLYVKAHPDRLMITAPGKIHKGEKVTLNKLTLNECYAGRLLEFAILGCDSAQHQRNEDTIRRVWEGEKLEPAVRWSMRSGSMRDISAKGWIVRGVANEIVTQFLKSFEVHATEDFRKNGVLKYLHEIAGKYPHCDVLLISPHGRSAVSTPLRLGVQVRTFVTGDTVPSEAKRVNKYRVASRGDEGLGLTREQWREADSYRQESNSRRGLIDFDFRKARKRPLLMIHVLVDKREPDIRMPTIGMSFPVDDVETQVQVVANPTWVKLRTEGAYGLTGNEEDF